jgi:hypothetical protein
MDCALEAVRSGADLQPTMIDVQPPKNNPAPKIDATAKPCIFIPLLAFFPYTAQAARILSTRHF